ncbi:uncharacterized protein B0H18DRAFT_1037740 [Fomitopsis serialis]|uniref:uncharacterized protein n=1 Tax=Fomitopsis serialis TaxID=139415 RepID=UPI002008728D|nr:uncharacterized protein B0H18DRAFT_1037740 [Neoantrodia serialis]KAH9916693.1 hypothetical protein B0H18DRAFT_1037740 [Neoantrodia serialis]
MGHGKEANRLAIGEYAPACSFTCPLASPPARPFTLSPLHPLACSPALRFPVPSSAHPAKHRLSRPSVKERNGGRARFHV